MWQNYDPDGTQPEQPAEAASYEPSEQDRPMPVYSLVPSSRSGTRLTFRGAGAANATGGGFVAAVIGVVAVVAVALIAASGAHSAGREQRQRDSWQQCIDEEQEGGRLLSPEDICRIGHQEPSDWVESSPDDDDPFGLDGGGGFGN